MCSCKDLETNVVSRLKQFSKTSNLESCLSPGSQHIFGCGKNWATILKGPGDFLKYFQL